MTQHKLTAIVLGLLACSAVQAEGQSASNGFIEDSHLNVLLRNAYINRDKKHHTNDQVEWGLGAIGTFSSGFTQGPVGFGVDAFGLYALRLDGGKGRSGGAGIDFFKQGDSGAAANDIGRAGGAVKMRVSNTVITYGDQMPALPVLSHDNSRLLPETYTGTLLTSNEIEGLTLHAGHFTAQSRKSAEGRDSGGLKSIDVLGGSYQFNEHLRGALYASDVDFDQTSAFDSFKRQYLNLNYAIPLQDNQSLTFDFNGYRTKQQERFGGNDTNRIWSLAATYAFGMHSLTLAHQRSSGSTGFNYGWYQNAGGPGDGGTTIWLANSYWSDFNAKDENSWQLAYGYDFAQYGLPGLRYNVAYVRGDNIDTGGNGRGDERELFNQIQYTVQSGAAKDLNVRLRSSILRVSSNARDYNDDGNEIRFYVDYPLSVF